MPAFRNWLLTAGGANVESRSRKTIKRFGAVLDAKRIDLKLLPGLKDADLNLPDPTLLARMVKDRNACHASKIIPGNQDIPARISEVEVIHSRGCDSADDEGEKQTLPNAQDMKKRLTGWGVH